MVVDAPFLGVFGGGRWLLLRSNNAPNSASAADDITALMIVALVRIAPLMGGDMSLFDKKKCLPAPLRAFFSLRYLALLCTLSIILLAEYVIIASSCIAQ